jgi:S-adenosylmethionine decarboxylase
MVGFIKENGTQYAGKHLLVDFHGCENHGTITEVRQTLEDACVATGATVLSSNLHPFPGGGCSGVIILAESGLSIHSWPEEQFVALDIFVCGECDPLLALPVLHKHFVPTRTVFRLEKRGLL